jgi:hypothetical protein
MKKVFTNRELPHIWANQLQNEGRGSNMFFEGPIIYSYGKHFPIAEILEKEKVILVNSSNYSITTSKHKGYVWRAINREKYKSFSVPGCSNNHSKNISIWMDTFNNYVESASTARNNKELYLNSAKYTLSTIEEYLETFKLNKLKFKGLSIMLRRKENILPIELENKIKEQKKRNRRLLLEEKKQDIKEWIEGNRSNLPYKIDDVFLRVVHPAAFEDEDSQVETSKGARVGYNSAKLLYSMIKAGKDVKGHKIDGYTVIGINGVLKIGCHQIERKEIDRFAKSQNW